MASSEEVERLARSISQIIAALLVANRQGEPAEGLLPFNPLHFHLLRLLAANEAMRPSALADALGVARTTVSTAVRALQKRNLVASEADPTDGRAQILRLTPVGALVVSAIERQDLRNAGAMLQGVAPERASVFVDVIEEIAMRLSGTSSKP